MEAFRADCPHGVRLGRLPVEVPAAQRYALGAWEDQRTGIGGDEADRCSRRAGMIARNADDPAPSSGLARPGGDGGTSRQIGQLSWNLTRHF